MKRAIVIFTAAIFAMPALAGMSSVSPVGVSVKDASAAPRGTRIYADLATCGSFLDNGTASMYPLPIADDIHAISGGTITSFTMGYYVPTVTNFNLTVLFYTNTPACGKVPHSGRGRDEPADLIGGLVIYGLPGDGAWFVTVDLGPGAPIVVGPDFWFEQWWAYTTPPIATGGPLLTGDSGGSTGFSHDWYAQTSAKWTLGSVWADFVLAFNIVPEPATIGLLGLGGLIALRRRY